MIKSINELLIFLIFIIILLTLLNSNRYDERYVYENNKNIVDSKVVRDPRKLVKVELKKKHKSVFDKITSV